MPGSTFGKNERLKSRKLIEQLFKEGKSFNAFPFRVYYQFQPTQGLAPSSSFHIRFGCGVSTKNFKKAVDRNRIKRLMKEAWRLQKSIVEETARTGSKNGAVFFIYTQKELPDYKTISDKTELILKKLVKIIDETDSPGT